jgi:hypothetical protein
MRRSLPIIFSVVIAAAGLVRCGKMEDAISSRAELPRSAAHAADEAEPSSGEKDKTGLGQPGAGAESPMPRKIIRNGEVRVVVKAYEPARKKIEAMVRKAGGYISKSDVQHSLGHVSSATLVLRVPAGRFDGLVSHILRLGVVERESISSRDITEEYYDLKARLSNARKLEARFLELLQKKAGKVSELLQVEKELARVREKIERLEGKLKLFDNLVDLSTLTVHLSIQEKYVPPKPPSLGDDAGETLSGSWDALKSAGRGIVLLFVALLPWLVPLGLITFITIWLIRRSIRKHRAKLAARLAGQGPTKPPAQ